MPPLSRAATLPIIHTEQTSDEKTKRGKTLAQISSKGLARTMSKIMVESSGSAAPDVLKPDPWTDIMSEKFATIISQSNFSMEDVDIYFDSEDYIAQCQMTRLKRDSMLKRWQDEEEIGPSSTKEEGEGKEDQDPLQRRRKEAIKLYESRWKDLVTSEDTPQDMVIPWRSFSDLPWPSFELLPQPDELFPHSGRPSITPLNFPITYESTMEFMFGLERSQMSNNRTLEELYEDELFFWAIDPLDERVINKVKQEDTFAVLFAFAAIIAPMWCEAKKIAEEKEWEEFLKSYGIEGL